MSEDIEPPKLLREPPKGKEPHWWPRPEKCFIDWKFKPQYFPDPEIFRRGDYVPDWNYDPEVQFTGMSRLGEVYHPVELFYKFPPISEHRASYNRWWWTTVFFFAGVAGCAYIQKRHGRPLYAQIWKHLYYGGTAGAFTYAYFYYNQRNAMRRDAVMKHYMETYPDRFPLVKRQKYDKVLMEWNPVRN